MIHDPKNTKMNNYFYIKILLFCLFIILLVLLVVACYNY